MYMAGVLPLVLLFMTTLELGTRVFVTFISVRIREELGLGYTSLHLVLRIHEVRH